MLKRLCSTFIIVFCSTTLSGQPSENHDPAFFPRVPGFSVGGRVWNAALWIQDKEGLPKGDHKKNYQSTYFYNKEEGASTTMGVASVMAYYRKLVSEAPGEKISESARTTGDIRDRYYSAGITIDNKEYWIKVTLFKKTKSQTDSSCMHFALYIIEKKAAGVISANELNKSIQSTGKVAQDIRFASGLAEIEPSSMEQIEQLAFMLKTNAGLRVSIEGHTDNIGNNDGNKTLSLKRAQAVKKEIAKKGIDPSRMTCTGWGQEKPVGDNNTETGSAKNRRVEIVKKQDGRK